MSPWGFLSNSWRNYKPLLVLRSCPTHAPRPKRKRWGIRPTIPAKYNDETWAETWRRLENGWCYKFQVFHKMLVALNGRRKRKSGSHQLSPLTKHSGRLSFQTVAINRNASSLLAVAVNSQHRRQRGRLQDLNIWWRWAPCRLFANVARVTENEIWLVLVFQCWWSLTDWKKNVEWQQLNHILYNQLWFLAQHERLTSYRKNKLTTWNFLSLSRFC